MNLAEAIMAEKERLRAAGLYELVRNPRTGRPRGMRYGGVLAAYMVDRVCYAYGMVPDMVALIETMKDGSGRIGSGCRVFLSDQEVWPLEMESKLGVMWTPEDLG